MTSGKLVLVVNPFVFDFNETMSVKELLRLQLTCQKFIYIYNCSVMYSKDKALDKALASHEHFVCSL